MNDSSFFTCNPKFVVRKRTYPVECTAFLLLEKSGPGLTSVRRRKNRCGSFSGVPGIDGARCKKPLIRNMNEISEGKIRHAVSNPCAISELFGELPASHA